MALLHMGSDGCCRVPPGFRFHPTDEELVNYYLRKKVGLEKFDLEVIREVDINKLEPWDLQERCQVDSTEQMDWYFFSHKDRKYPSGTRTNRATLAGFWKATGRDKAVISSLKRIGMRKTLVFYRGRAPRGTKTDWIMHEYRLEEIDADNVAIGNEEGWVVCRVFKKHNLPKNKGNHHEQYAPPSISFEDKGKLNTTTMPKMLDYNWKDSLPSLVTCKQELVNYNNANNHILEFSELSPRQMNSRSMDMDQLFIRLDSNPSVFPEFLGSSDSSNNSQKSPFISEELIIEYCNMSGGGGHSSSDWDVIESIYEEKNTTTAEDNTMNSNELLDVFLHPISKPQLSELYNLNIVEGETWSLPR